MESVSMAPGDVFALPLELVEGSFMVGMGWDVRTSSGHDFDLDGVCLILDSKGKVLSPSHFIFYHNLSSAEGAVLHRGDNLDGDGDGDDEVMIITLRLLPAEASRVLFATCIYDAHERNQSVQNLLDVYIRVADLATYGEAARFDISEGLEGSGSVIVLAELARSELSWRFNSIGETHASLAQLLQDHGLDVG